MKVLVAIDDSEYAKKLVDDIIERQWTAGTEFNVLTVDDMTRKSERAKPVSSAPMKLCVSEHLKSLCRQACQRLGKHIPNASISYEIRQGDAKTQIVKAAQDWKADKIIIGSHSRDICPRTVPSSVSQGVGLLAECEVEVINTRDDACVF